MSSGLPYHSVIVLLLIAHYSPQSPLLSRACTGSPSQCVTVDPAKRIAADPRRYPVGTVVLGPPSSVGPIIAMARMCTRVSKEATQGGQVDIPPLQLHALG